MSIEISNSLEIDPTIQHNEMLWIGNLHRVYKNVQNEVDQVLTENIPNLNIAPPPPVLIVPDDDFKKFIMRGIENVTITDSELSAIKKNEIIVDGEIMANAAYISSLQSIVLPESFARMFQKSGVAGMTAKCVLMEEYIHHVTTVILPDGTVDRMGFCKMENDNTTPHNYRSGSIYTANIDDMSHSVLLEAGGDHGAVLTENATDLLVNLITEKFGGYLYSNRLVYIVGVVSEDEELESALFAPSNRLLNKLITALMEGDVRKLQIKLPLVNGRGETNIKDWLEKDNLRIMLVDPKMKSNNQSVNIFCYLDINNYKQ